MLPWHPATARSIEELIEKGGVRRDPHEIPMLKHFFVARCQRRLGSPVSDAIIFVNRSNVWSMGTVGQDASKLIRYVPRTRVLNMTMRGSASARRPSGSRDSRSRSMLRNCGSPRAICSGPYHGGMPGQPLGLRARIGNQRKSVRAVGVYVGA